MHGHARLVPVIDVARQLSGSLISTSPRLRSASSMRAWSMRKWISACRSTVAVAPVDRVRSWRSGAQDEAGEIRPGGAEPGELDRIVPREAGDGFANEAVGRRHPDKRPSRTRPCDQPEFGRRTSPMRCPQRTRQSFSSARVIAMKRTSMFRGSDTAHPLAVIAEQIALIVAGPVVGSKDSSPQPADTLNQVIFAMKRMHCRAFWGSHVLARELNWQVPLHPPGPGAVQSSLGRPVPNPHG